MTFVPGGRSASANWRIRNGRKRRASGFCDGSFGDTGGRDAGATKITRIPGTAFRAWPISGPAVPSARLASITRSVGRWIPTRPIA